MIRLVKIKFRPAGRHYDFNAQNYALKNGDRIVVETDRGRALGIVVQAPQEVPRSTTPEDLKSVLRPASEEDLQLATTNAAREGEAFRFCKLRIAERKMEMKLVRAEYLFDGSKIIFYFTADGRVDFRELVKDLAHHFHTRIEMRQIGVRDEAKLTGGLGICGRELCCCSFLTEFAPVSVKMAKEQGLALNPNKISGQCGRLLCCLAYEYETYCALKKALPKCGRKVQLDGREGEVISQEILRQTVTVQMADGPRVQVSAGELEKGEFLNPPPATPPPGTGSRGGPASRRSSSGRDGAPSRPDRPAQPSRRPQAAKPEPAAAAPPAPPPTVETPAVPPPAEETRKKRQRNRRRSKRN